MEEEQTLPPDVQDPTSQVTPGTDPPTTETVPNPDPAPKGGLIEVLYNKMPEANRPSTLEAFTEIMSTEEYRRNAYRKFAKPMGIQVDENEFNTMIRNQFPEQKIEPSGITPEVEAEVGAAVDEGGVFGGLGRMVSFFNNARKMGGVQADLAGDAELFDLSKIISGEGLIYSDAVVQGKDITHISEAIKAQRILSEKMQIDEKSSGLFKGAALVSSTLTSSIASTYGKVARDIFEEYQKGNTVVGGLARAGAQTMMSINKAMSPAMILAGADIEAGSTFFARVSEAGRKAGYDPENPEELAIILNDPSVRENAQRGAKIAGATIAAVDAISAVPGAAIISRGANLARAGAVASKLGRPGQAVGKVLNKAAAATPLQNASVYSRIGASQAVEAAGGAGGEALKTALLGEEQSAQNIILEGIVGAAASPVTDLLPAYIGLAKEKGRKERMSLASDALIELHSDPSVDSSPEAMANIVERLKDAGFITRDTDDADAMDLFTFTQEAWDSLPAETQADPATANEAMQHILDRQRLAQERDAAVASMEGQSKVTALLSGKRKKRVEELDSQIALVDTALEELGTSETSRTLDDYNITTNLHREAQRTGMRAPRAAARVRNGKLEVADESTRPAYEAVADLAGINLTNRSDNVDVADMSIPETGEGTVLLPGAGPVMVQNGPNNNVSIDPTADVRGASTETLTVLGDNIVESGKTFSQAAPEGSPVRDLWTRLRDEGAATEKDGVFTFIPQATRKATATKRMEKVIADTAAKRPVESDTPPEDIGIRGVVGAPDSATGAKVFYPEGGRWKKNGTNVEGDTVTVELSGDRKDVHVVLDAEERAMYNEGKAEFAEIVRKKNAYEKANPPGKKNRAKPPKRPKNTPAMNVYRDVVNAADRNGQGDTQVLMDMRREERGLDSDSEFMSALQELRNDPNLTLEEINDAAMAAGLITEPLKATLFPNANAVAQESRDGIMPQDVPWSDFRGTAAAIDRFIRPLLTNWGGMGKPGTQTFEHQLYIAEKMNLRDPLPAGANDADTGLGKNTGPIVLAAARGKMLNEYERVAIIEAVMRYGIVVENLRSQLATATGDQWGILQPLLSNESSLRTYTEVLTAQNTRLGRALATLRGVVPMPGQLRTDLTTWMTENQEVLDIKEAEDAELNRLAELAIVHLNIWRASKDKRRGDRQAEERAMADEAFESATEGELLDIDELYADSSVEIDGVFETDSDPDTESFELDDDAPVGPSGGGRGPSLMSSSGGPSFTMSTAAEKSPVTGDPVAKIETWALTILTYPKPGTDAARERAAEKRDGKGPGKPSRMAALNQLAKFYAKKFEDKGKEVTVDNMARAIRKLILATPKELHPGDTSLRRIKADLIDAVDADLKEFNRKQQTRGTTAAQAFAKLAKTVKAAQDLFGTLGAKPFSELTSEDLATLDTVFDKLTADTAGVTTSPASKSTLASIKEILTTLSTGKIKSEADFNALKKRLDATLKAGGFISDTKLNKKEQQAEIDRRLGLEPLPDEVTKPETPPQKAAREKWEAVVKRLRAARKDMEAGGIGAKAVEIPPGPTGELSPVTGKPMDKLEKWARAVLTSPQKGTPAYDIWENAMTEGTAPTELNRMAAINQLARFYARKMDGAGAPVSMEAVAAAIGSLMGTVTKDRHMIDADATNMLQTMIEALPLGLKDYQRSFEKRRQSASKALENVARTARTARDMLNAMTQKPYSDLTPSDQRALKDVFNRLFDEVRSMPSAPGTSRTLADMSNLIGKLQTGKIKGPTALAGLRHAMDKVMKAGGLFAPETMSKKEMQADIDSRLGFVPLSTASARSETQAEAEARMRWEEAIGTLEMMKAELKYKAKVAAMGPTEYAAHVTSSRVIKFMQASRQVTFSFDLSMIGNQAWLPILTLPPYVVAQGVSHLVQKAFKIEGITAWETAKPNYEYLLSRSWASIRNAGNPDGSLVEQSIQSTDPDAQEMVRLRPDAFTSLSKTANSRQKEEMMAAELSSWSERWEERIAGKGGITNPGNNALRKIAATPAWIAKKGFQGSENAYTNMMNAVRIFQYKQFVSANPAASESSRQFALEHIMDQTGRGVSRGKVGDLMAHPGMATIFAAPRLYLSRANMVAAAPRSAWNLLNAATSKKPTETYHADLFIMKQYGAMMASFMAFQLMMSMIGVDEEEKDYGESFAKSGGVKWDPRELESPDYMKIKWADKSYDPTAGVGAFVRLMGTTAYAAHRAVRGETATDEFFGEPVATERARLQQLEPLSQFGKMASYKTTPAVTSLVSLATGTDAIGRSLGTNGWALAGTWLTNGWLPIPFQDGVKSLINRDIDLGEERMGTGPGFMENSVRTGASLVGANIVSYENNIKHAMVANYLDKIDYVPSVTTVDSERHIKGDNDFGPKFKAIDKSVYRDALHEKYRQAVEDEIGSWILNKLAQDEEPTKGDIKAVLYGIKSRVGALAWEQFVKGVDWTKVPTDEYGRPLK